MYKKIIVLLFMLAPLSLFAQKFGHVNSAEIIQAMPEYTLAQTELKNLEKQYSDDLKRLQDELTKKNDEYDAQKETLPQNIRERREKEIQELYQKLQQYYQETQQNLQQSSQEKMSAITEKLTKAIKEVGVEGGFLYIFDQSSGIPYISETLSTDVSSLVRAKLGLK